MKKEKSQNLWNPVVSNGGERRYKADRDAGTGRKSSRKKLLLEPMEGNRDRVWNTKLRAVLDVWLGWIVAFLNQGSEEKKEV